MPFSRINCSAIAVDDIARPMPPTTAACQENAVSINNPASTTALSITCAAPTPKIERRSCHSLAGLSSNPMMNIRKTTPSSEKCRISSTSLMNPNPHGPMAIPASKYPNTGPIPNRDANGTAATAAKRNNTPAVNKSEPSISGLPQGSDSPASHHTLSHGCPAPASFAFWPSKR